MQKVPDGKVEREVAKVLEMTVDLVAARFVVEASQQLLHQLEVFQRSVWGATAGVEPKPLRHKAPKKEHRGSSNIMNKLKHDLPSRAVSNSNSKARAPNPNSFMNAVGAKLNAAMHSETLSHTIDGSVPSIHQLQPHRPTLARALSSESSLLRNARSNHPHQVQVLKPLQHAISIGGSLANEYEEALIVVDKREEYVPCRKEGTRLAHRGTNHIGALWKANSSSPDHLSSAPSPTLEDSFKDLSHSNTRPGCTVALPIIVSSAPTSLSRIEGKPSPHDHKKEMHFVHNTKADLTSGGHAYTASTPALSSDPNSPLHFFESYKPSGAVSLQLNQLSTDLSNDSSSELELDGSNTQASCSKKTLCSPKLLQKRKPKRIKRKSVFQRLHEHIKKPEKPENSQISSCKEKSDSKKLYKFVQPDAMEQFLHMFSTQPVNQDPLRSPLVPQTASHPDAGRTNRFMLKRLKQINALQMATVRWESLSRKEQWRMDREDFTKHVPLPASTDGAR